MKKEEDSTLLERTILLHIAYDGTNYHGWQIQPNGITIEEVLNRAVSDLCQEEIQVIGASRTDSGVHAIDNIAVFSTNFKMDATKICYALNQRLPDDIRIMKSYETTRGFHPRRCRSKKEYKYQIYCDRIEDPLVSRYTCFEYCPVDVEKMKEAAKYLVGEHDFKSFCAVRTQARTTVREIYKLDITKEGNIITIIIEGNGFLFNMVRIIVGTLLKVGRGAYEPPHVQTILEAGNRSLAGPTACAKGLTLNKYTFLEE